MPIVETIYAVDVVDNCVNLVNQLRIIRKRF